MKQFLLFIAAMFCFSTANAQLNMVLRSEVQFDQGSLNDVWGWHHEPTGKEYALVGRTVGTSVIDVTDPDNPVDVGFFPGANSTWRDIKTWGDYAYVTNEQGLGVAVLYLGDLPSGGDLTGFNWEPNIPGQGQLNSCHNIYIDEFGYAYLAGCNLNGGGMLIVDVFTTPGQPEFVSAAPNVYSHDVFTRENKMYSSEIYGGVFTIYDVADKQNITELGSQPTQFNFTHNTWLSDDSNTIFTTDEEPDAPVGAYDVSDPTDIVELDQFLPLETLGDGVIPHNVHVWQDWLIISYYSDGGIVADASEPDNIIEVGNFDTFFGGGTGFNGSWGAYPFLPSETVLLTDIDNGLYIVTPNYVRACRIEGFVTDINTGAAINGADISIDANQANMGTTDFIGQYKTGIATAGTYSVTYSALGYLPQTVELDLENGVIVMQDVQLGEAQIVNVSGLTVESGNSNNIADAQVIIFNEDINFNLELTSDANGSFNLTNIYEGTYSVLAGKWGYRNFSSTINISQGESITLELEKGYQDDFVFDYDWMTTGNAESGDWERGVPVGTTYQGSSSNPGSDVDNDLGNTAYVTGNSGGGAGSDDVDAGAVILISPVMDFTTYIEPVLNYRLWFFNDGGANGGGAPNDELTVSISNGTDVIEIENINDSQGNWRPNSLKPLDGLIEYTNNMTLIVETADLGDGHLVEGGFDAFLVMDNAVSTIYQPVGFNVSLTAAPNPFSANTVMDYTLYTDFDEARFVVHNQLGQEVELVELTANEGTIALGAKLATGMYFLRLEVDGVLVATEKIVKE